ncbi:hypothetical protein TELCIR_09169 [Teladorsagia circumcincta]|uniref:Uncharacterized protein n=1 Tax=Teladorsagia circumcincta TaxID=45464 RepID=A0A2G9UFK2_TELCI|nr:hypothetical protein TELCIR_09169 [Teladorsagia circumcincta]
MAIDAHFSVEKALKRAEIVPRNEPYRLDDIRDALGEGLSNGFHVQLHCLTDRKTRQTLLGDVRMCIDKSFQPIDCPRSGAFQPAVHLSGHSPPLPSFKVFIQPMLVVEIRKNSLYNVCFRNALHL